MSRQVLVVLGHPCSDSLCAGLATAYADAARAAGAQVRVLRLGSLVFDPLLHAGYRQVQTLEPDLVAAQQDILWAQHLVWVYPIWWGAMPALLKGFIDKVFTNGWAYKPSKHGVEGRLTHIERAVVVTMMNTPKWAYRWLYGNAVQRALVRGTLRKCGVRKVQWVALSPVRHATDAKRQAWLQQVGAMFGA